MGRWLGRVAVLLLALISLWAILAFAGRPRDPQMIEVDVTDRLTHQDGK